MAVDLEPWSPSAGAAPDRFGASRPSDLAPFRELPVAARSRALLEVNALLGALVCERALDILAALGVGPGPLDASGDALAARAGVHPDRRASFDWLLALLESRGLLHRGAGDAFARLDPAPWPRETLAAALAEAEGAAGSSVALVERAAAHYPAVLRGERLGARVLFSADSLPLWAAYFDNATPVTAAVNALAAALAERVAPRRPLSVLEVGSGCGSSALALVEALGPRLAHLTLSDNAPILLARGRRAVAAAFPALALEARRLDLDRSLVAQGVAPRSVDVVLGVNTAHAARAPEASLRWLGEVLAPDGALVLGEAVRAAPARPVAFELVFQLSDRFAGFFPWCSWEPLLRAAGFAEVDLLPGDMAEAVRAYPDFTLCGLAARGWA